MTSKKISQLPAATSVSDSDISVIVQGGVTKKAETHLLRSTTKVDAILSGFSNTADAASALEGRPASLYVAGMPAAVFNPSASSFPVTFLPGSIGVGLYWWNGSSLSYARPLLEQEGILAGAVIVAPDQQFYTPLLWRVIDIGGGPMLISAAVQSAFSSYDPTASGLTATTVQAAIDEVAASAGGGGGRVAPTIAHFNHTDPAVEVRVDVLEVEIAVPSGGAEFSFVNPGAGRWAELMVRVAYSGGDDLTFTGFNNHFGGLNGLSSVGEYRDWKVLVMGTATSHPNTDWAKMSHGSI